ncbi:unnamed protein product [Caenorhabditis angaria]|uniref:Uncharacterized protein n=1 Tax=Caenorhabditis angaria TaxID=860376 RepID=A0A9P1J0D4_9PELO|nr:unnamed protein product [Caenorhabditis angaria]
MEVFNANTDVTKYGAELFKVYSDTVFANNYEKLFDFYDENAVLLEKGKESFFGSKAIIQAIKSYHDKLGPSSTENYNLRIEHAGNVLVITSKYKVQSAVDNKVIEGDYIQFWRCDIGETPKIIRDEFTIDNEH